MPTVPTIQGPPSGSTGLPTEPFADRAVAAMQEHGPLVFGLDPSGDLLAEWGLGDTADGLERFVDIVVDASVGTVGIVKPQAAFYERHGWQGIRSLARLIDACRHAGVLVLLDAKRGDVGSTNEAYAEAYLGPEAAIEVDAITITPYLGLAAMQPILDRAMANGAGVFIVTRSSNPEGRSIQGARHGGATTVEHQLIIDMAADGGGNCELTKVGEVVEHHGVRIVGMANPPAEMGASASFMYANNVLKLLALFGSKGQLAPDWNDEVVIGVTVARDGAINHAPTGLAHVAIVPAAKEIAE